MRSSLRFDQWFTSDEQGDHQRKPASGEYANQSNHNGQRKCDADFDA